VQDAFLLQLFAEVQELLLRLDLQHYLHASGAARPAGC
jgi:hypothetical protein